MSRNTSPRLQPLIPSLSAMSYDDDDSNYLDEFGNEVRINTKRNIKQTKQGRFTIVEEFTPPRSPPASLFPVNSYGEDPDYLDEFGYEVRINKKRPTERQTQMGRFTIVDEISPKSDPKKSKKKSKKSYVFYPRQKVGRFTVKSITKPIPRPSSKSPKIKITGFSARLVPKPRSPPKSPKIKITSLKLKSKSPLAADPRSPKVKIGRFTIKKVK